MKTRSIRCAVYILNILCLAILASLATLKADDKSPGSEQPAAKTPPKPNVVIIFIDDHGYGDLSCYGSKTQKTPRIDKLAQEGTRFTNFYAQPVCGPSRAALMTGRYPARSGGWSVPNSEITMGELFQQAGYATACIGKWDISGRKEVIEKMPLAQGFDYFWGALGANDGGSVKIHENNTKSEVITDMGSLTRRYTDKSIEFIKSHKDKPFYLQLSHTMVHSVLGASPEFKGKSKGGLYGDALEELDFYTGKLLDALDEHGLAKNTIVIYTSDNGPWNNNKQPLRRSNNGEIAWGSATPLRDGKGSTYEGGFRVPCIIRWPGQIPEKRDSDAIFSTLDFLPTFATLAGYKAPNDRTLDGFDQTELLLGKSQTGARDVFYYFWTDELQCVRWKEWKLRLPNLKKFARYIKDVGTQEIELYNLNDDISEKKNVAKEHPEIVKQLLKLSEQIDISKK